MVNDTATENTITTAPVITIKGNGLKDLSFKLL